MKNRNVLIAGQIGSGKTTLARKLVEIAPRAVILDPEWDYEEGEIIDDFGEALQYYLEFRASREFKLIFRPDNLTESLGLIKLVCHAQRVERLDPLALILEEASEYSDQYHIAPEIAELYRKGRHWRINAVSVIQMETDIHRIIRSQTQFWVTLFQMKLTTDYQRFFDQKTVTNLKPLTPGVEPKQNTHFAVAPGYVDLFTEWERINRHE